MTGTPHDDRGGAEPVTETQPERTAMAWQRTGLSLATLAVTLVAIDKEAVHWVVMAPSLVALLAGVWLLVAAGRRYRLDRRVISPEAAERTADGRLLLVACLATACLGVAALLAFPFG